MVDRRGNRPFTEDRVAGGVGLRRRLGFVFSRRSQDWLRRAACGAKAKLYGLSGAPGIAVSVELLMPGVEFLRDEMHCGFMKIGRQRYVDLEGLPLVAHGERSGEDDCFGRESFCREVSVGTLDERFELLLQVLSREMRRGLQHGGRVIPGDVGK